MAQVEKRESNYEIMKREMQAKFAAFDLDRDAEAWSLDRTGADFLFRFVGRDYRIERQSGAVLFAGEGPRREADYNVSMTIFDVLTRSPAEPSGEYLPVSSFSGLHSATAASGGMFDGRAREFNGREAALSGACIALGGEPFGKGDVAFRLPLFRDWRVLFQFWSADEDFPPEIHFFCDKALLRLMHFETMMFMLIHILDRLSEELAAR